MWSYSFPRSFENGNRDISSDTWEVVKKLIEWLATLQVVKEIFDRHASAGKDGDAALDFRIYRYEGFAHFAMIRRPLPVVANGLCNRRAGRC